MPRSVPLVKLTTAQQAMVEEHLGIAFKAADQVWRQWVVHCEHADLVGAAVLSLCKSAQKYRVDGGAQFSTYAYRGCLRAALEQRDENRLLRVPHWGHNKHRADAQASRQVSAINHATYKLLYRLDEEAPFDLNEVLSHLSDYNRNLIYRWLGGATNKELAREQSISKTQMRNRLNSALLVLWKHRHKWGLI